MPRPQPAGGAPQDGQGQDQGIADLYFPLSGIDVSFPLENQTPDTTPEGVNVRAFEPSTNRARGGARPGLSNFMPLDQLPHDFNPAGTRGIQHIQIVVDPQAEALGASFVDDGSDAWNIIIPNITRPYILGDLSWDTTGPQGSGYKTNKNKKRKHPQLVIKANNESKAVGTEFTWTGNEFTILHGDLQPGDSILTVAFQSRGAPTDAAVGTYPIVPSKAVVQQVLGHPTYAISYVNGTMTVGSEIAFIQARNATNVGIGTTVTFNFPGTDEVLTGDLLVIAIRSVYQTSIGGEPAPQLTGPVTDSIGNTYTQAGATANQPDPGSGIAIWIAFFYCISMADSPTLPNVSANLDTPAVGDDFLAGFFWNFEGTGPSPLEGTSSGQAIVTGTGITTISTGPVPITGAGRALVAIIVSQFVPGGTLFPADFEVDDTPLFVLMAGHGLELSLPTPVQLQNISYDAGGPGAKQQWVAMGVSFK